MARRRTAATVLSLAVISGAAILWPTYKKKATQRRLAEAAKLYRAGAEHGDKQAQYRFGFTSYYGEGVPRDYVEAVRWSRQAAERGDAVAQWYLGRAYRLGLEVPRDCVQAAGWYLKVFGPCGLRSMRRTGWTSLVALLLVVVVLVVPERR